MASTQTLNASLIPSDIPRNYDNIKTNDKADDDFRIYSEEASEKRVVDHYRDMRKFQTVNFYQKMEQIPHNKVRGKPMFDRANKIIVLMI